MSNEQKEPQSEQPKTESSGHWIAIGIAIGVAIGVAMENVGIGIAIGLAIGAGIGAAQSQRNKNK